MKYLYVILLTMIFVNITAAKDSLDASKQDNYTIELLKNDVKEIRRDELNYKIEKDLLKETYSSNYTTVQIIISLILGIFAILGYLGLKGIFSLKKEYDAELVKLKDLKSVFEAKLNELSSSQEKVKEQITTIDSLNEVQNKKIKLLEIKEKVGSLYSQNNYQHVLDYVDIGVELSKDDLELLIYRAFTLLNLKKYSEALEAHKKVAIIDPTNGPVIRNLAELYLMLGQIDNYDNLHQTRGELLKSDNNSLLTYFETFKFFKQGNIADLKRTISTFIEKEDLSINKNHIGTWKFDEMHDTIEAIENSPAKTLFVNFTNYLKGNMSGSQIKPMLDEQ